MKNYTCLTCTHWANVIGHAPMTGECHRIAPTVPLDGEPGAVWPSTRPQDACGEWKLVTVEQREARGLNTDAEMKPNRSLRRSGPMTPARKGVQSKYMHVI